MLFKDFIEEELKEAGNSKDYEAAFDLEVSNLIAFARLRSGFTQGKLAEKIGTKQPAIARYESGTSIPTLTVLKKIAKVIGAKLIPPRFDFMGEDGEIVDIVSDKKHDLPISNTIRKIPLSSITGQGLTEASPMTSVLKFS
ncbi:MAG: helix-turn-helix transcriptional regulator [Candidatus Colwellbacteria bacterium]|nr:helix-turn-helix transcriptional regulator [Candidatus Colwellbacteria bacterium]